MPCRTVSSFPAIFTIQAGTPICIGVILVELVSNLHHSSIMLLTDESLSSICPCLLVSNMDGSWEISSSGAFHFETGGSSTLKLGGEEGLSNPSKSDIEDVQGSSRTIQVFLFGLARGGNNISFYIPNNAIQMDRICQCSFFEPFLN